MIKVSIEQLQNDIKILAEHDKIKTQRITEMEFQIQQIVMHINGIEKKLVHNYTKDLRVI